MDGVDVLEREKQECTQLGQDGPILGPAQDDAWAQALGTYDAGLQALDGQHDVGPLRVTARIRDETGTADTVQKLREATGTPQGDEVPVYADALAIVCGRAVITTQQATYNGSSLSRRYNTNRRTTFTCC